MMFIYIGCIVDVYCVGCNLVLVWLGSLYGMDYWVVVKGLKCGVEVCCFIVFVNVLDV